MNIDDLYKNYWKLIEYRKEYSPTKKVLKAWELETNTPKSDTLNIILQYISLKENYRILDIGAGSKELETIIKKNGYKGNYYSMDICENIKHDYTSLNDIEGTYNAVFMMELIEHLPLSTSLEYLTKAYSILKKNGRLFLSTPNIEHINQLWKGDVTHIQQYPAKDIYSILRMLGFIDINLYRIYLTKPNLSFKRIIREKIKIILAKILEVDYTHGIMAIAKKL